MTDGEVDPGMEAPLGEVLTGFVVTGELPAELTVVSVMETAGVEDPGI